MEQQIYEVAVLGAGVIGSATAYYLASSGTRPVLLLEQGSSHGASRTTRRSYSKQCYTELMADAFPMWSEIERKSGKQLFIKAGLLSIGERANIEIQSYINSLKACGVSHDVFTGSEANRRYPDQLKLPDSYNCVYEPHAGVLRANRAVIILQELFVGHGGVLLDNHKVTRIIPGTVVTVETEKASFRAKRIIVTAGAWTNKLLRHTGLTLPLKVFRAEVFYWKVSESSSFSPPNFPAFFVSSYPDLRTIYSTCVVEYPGLIKICQYYGDHEVDPDERDAELQPKTMAFVSKFIGKHLKGVATAPSIFEICMYADTPDSDPVIDCHPQHQNIIIGAGFSHGFKMAPVVGKMLSELALGLPPSHNLSHFKINRFNTPRAVL